MICRNAAFAQLVASEMTELCLLFSFREIHRSTSSIRFESTSVYISFEQTQMGEVEMTFGPLLGEKRPFCVVDVIDRISPEEGAFWRTKFAFKDSEVVAAVREIVGILVSKGRDLLSGDLPAFERMAINRDRLDQLYHAKQNAETLRPEAELAFREGRYDRAAELYSQFGTAISPAERKKLEIARQRSTESSGQSNGAQHLFDQRQDRSGD